MRLTEAGEAAYDWAKEIVSRNQAVVREIAGLMSAIGNIAPGRVAEL